jgi:ketosteroid isomerase-like protein
MSQENLDIVRDGLDAWNRRDFEATLGNMDPGIVWRTSGVIPDLDEAYVGYDRLREFWRAWTGSWEHIQIETEELVDLDDKVLVLARFCAGSRDEITVHQPIAFLFTIRDGLVTEFQSYWERDNVYADIAELDVRSNPDAGGL